MTGLYVASNPTALTAQFSLTNNMGALSDTLTRLSTGLRINSGKDDPAGLIASSLLKAQITGTTKAISNTQRANSMISTADTALGQVSNLLNDIKGLVVEAANEGAMSADQIRANQLQVDASINSIDRIATTTSYAGKKLLDGSMGFTTSGTDGNVVSNLKIDQANFGTADKIAIDVSVKELARKGTLIYNGTGVSQKTTIDVTGSSGTKSFTFGAGATNAEMAERINASSDSTGVTARVEGAAERGSVILSSAGANNDILITALDKGLDNGNYSFKITHGTTNDARVVQEAANGQPGVIEISLTGAQEANFSNFAGMFNITNSDQTNGAKKVTLIQGEANNAQYISTATPASAKDSATGVALTVTAAGATAGGGMSQFNGWTISVDDAKAGGAGATKIDQTAKTLYIGTTTLDTDVSLALTNALGAATASNAALARAGGTANTWTAGQTFTFGGGGEAGELVVTYAEGATVGDIQDLINNAPNMQASLASGVSRSDLVPALPNGQTTATAAQTASKYLSSATSQDVIDLINSKLGHMFKAQALGSDGTGGRVTFMDAAADYGDVNLDNALRFTGMDDGPLVRMVTGKANQELGVTIIQPTEEDRANGIHTPILQIQLATDASGNSTTTAKDIADLFDRLGPAQTLGVSAEVLYPDGVDPNGGYWSTDECGNTSYIKGCGADYGLGIVQPTGVPGDCATQENDLVLLGTNQCINDDYAIARVGSQVAVAAAAATLTDTDSNTAVATRITAPNTSALNGMTLNFTLDETKEGFDAASKTLTVYMDPTTFANANEATGTRIQDMVNGAIKDNWEAIREMNGAVGGPVELTIAANAANTVFATAAGNGAGVTFSAGVTANDPALYIKSKSTGTDMSGINITFIQDTTKGLTGNEILTEMIEDSSGRKTLVVYSAAATMSAANATAALKGNDLFNSMFDVTAGPAAATVLFSTDPTYVATTTQRGYRIESTPINSTVKTATSSGIGMTGQSDSNERLVLEAAEYGSEHFVKVDVISGSFDTYCPLGLKMNELAGTDIVATINGTAATGRGTNIEINTADLALSMDVTNKIGNTSFSITGGGALFQLGPDVVSTQQMRLGIPSMMSTKLGGSSGYLYQLKSGGDADLTKSNTSRTLADKIVNDAISSVASTRGYLGAIQKSSLEPNISVLQDSLVALTEANSLIEDADFAEESSNLTRLQLLVQAGMQTLGIANQFPQYAASLVR